MTKKKMPLVAAFSSACQRFPQTWDCAGQITAGEPTSLSCLPEAEVQELAPGVLVFEDEAGEVGYFGLDEGVLVKCGEEVSVAARRAVQGRDLAELRRLVEEEFLVFDEEELVARRALARLEAGVVRRMLDLERAS